MRNATCEKKCHSHSIWKICIAIIAIVGTCVAIFYFTVDGVKAAEANHMEISYGLELEPTIDLEHPDVTLYSAVMVHGSVGFYLSEKCKVSCEGKLASNKWVTAWQSKDFNDFHPSLDFTVTHLF